MVSCRAYDLQSITPAIDKVLSALKWSQSLHSSVVLLKPNLITARYGVLPCTEPAIIVAVARWFVEQGARVRIGDSPVFGSAAAALQILGVTRELKKLGVQVVDFTRVEKRFPGGEKNPGVASDVLESDLLVNLPRVKAHAQTRVTLAVKNYFGCLTGIRKPWWHMIYGATSDNFADQLVRLLSVLPDSITLLDGISCMERTGPIHGDLRSLGFLAGSWNPVAVDRSVHAIIDVLPSLSPLMKDCQQHKIPGAQYADLTFPVCLPDEFFVNDFLVPESLNPIRFNPLRFFSSLVKRMYSRYQHR